MIKEGLVASVAYDTGYNQNEVSYILEAVLDCITSELSKGNRVQLRGFGTFEAKQKAKRLARNPRTGEDVMIPERFVPIFKPGSHLKKSVKQFGESVLNTH